MSTVSDAPFRVLQSRLLIVIALLAGSVISITVLPLRLAVTSIVLGAAMLAIAAIDADRFIIPDWLSLPAIPAGLLASGHLLDPGAIELIDPFHVAAAAFGGASLWCIALIYRSWRGEDGLGFGDVKLTGAAGAWVGLELLSLVLLLAAGAALLWAVALAVRHREGLDSRMRVPFGAFLAPSIWTIWMASVSGYLG